MCCRKVGGKSSETCSIIQRHNCVEAKAASTLKIQLGVKRIGLFFDAGANIWAAAPKRKDPQNKNIVTPVWPCMKVLPRLLDNPSVLCVQVKKNGLSERISQEERKRQEVGTAVPLLCQFVAFTRVSPVLFKSLDTFPQRSDANAALEASALPQYCSR